MRYRDRRDAGRHLAGHLVHLRDRAPLVLALPRGGVPVGYEVARALGAPLDVLFVRKLGAPGAPELAVGAVMDGARPQRVVNEDVRRELAVPAAYIDAEASRQLAEIGRRRAVYGRGRPPADVAGRVVIVVDDGVATGATARAALRGLAQAGAAWRVLAVPVAPPEVVAALARECDEVVVPVQPHVLGAVGRFYDDFAQTSDAEVVELLRGAGG